MEQRKAHGSMLKLDAKVLVDALSSSVELHNIGMDSFIGACEMEVNVKFVTPEGKEVILENVPVTYSIEDTQEIHPSQMIVEDEEFQSELQEEMDRVEEVFKTKRFLDNANKQEV
ncbi:hypothetical protein ACQKJC_24745 [Priestia koreensis]|uniref:hypothetical protein n=1 Tax=Priestia koreensis TaxID=284581 RepID=UPI003D05E9E8